jgi:hypothetical protein
MKLKLRSLILITTVLALMVLAVSVHGEFTRLVSISGGSSAPRLMDSLVAAGYTGSASLDELMICNPTGAANTLYIGNVATVNASTGFPVAAGTCAPTYRAAARPINASSFFIFSAVTESAAISLRER